MKLTFKILVTAVAISVLSSCGSSGGETSDVSKDSSSIDLDTTDVGLQSDSISSSDAVPDSFPNDPERDTVVKK